MSDEIKLLPCPFCDSTDVRIRIDNLKLATFAYGECRKCYATGGKAYCHISRREYVDDDTLRMDAARKWNSRGDWEEEAAK